MPARRILVIGAGGFVGRHLCDALAARPSLDAEVIATGRQAGDAAQVLDVTDARVVASTIESLAPTHVVNLAGIAAPMAARRDPAGAWALHATAPETLGRIIGDVAPECWLLHVGSGMAYGRAALAGVPLSEITAMEPMDPYGVTKAAGDLAIGALANDGVRTLRARPFNHTGPGQTEDFVIPAFAAQIARIEAGLSDPVLKVGNLDAARDFLDIDDVVEAYCRMIESADTLEPGAVFNVASGTGLKIADALDMLLAETRHEITVLSDPDRQRPSDIPSMVGDAGALTRATGWEPSVSLPAMAARVLEHFRQTVRPA